MKTTRSLMIGGIETEEGITQDCTTDPGGCRRPHEVKVSRRVRSAREISTKKPGKVSPFMIGLFIPIASKYFGMQNFSC